MELKVTRTVAIASAAHAVTAMEVYMGRLVIYLVSHVRIRVVLISREATRVMGYASRYNMRIVTMTSGGNRRTVNDNWNFIVQLSPYRLRLVMIHNIVVVHHLLRNLPESNLPVLSSD